MAILQKPINVSDERLAEMVKARDENQQILAEIQKERESLRQEKAAFVVYKDEETQKLMDLKKKVELESSNLDRNRDAFESRVKQWEQDNMHKV